MKKKSFSVFLRDNERPSGDETQQASSPVQNIDRNKFKQNELIDMSKGATQSQYRQEEALKTL